MSPTNIAVSIIVPITKASLNYADCIESIQSQTLKNIEIILIIDSSAQVPESQYNNYLNKDKRITIINKEGVTYGAACNCGIDAAHGEYIGLVEPGDWIEKDMYEKLYLQGQIHSTDVVKCLPYIHKGNEILIDADINTKKKLYDVKITDKFLIPNFYLTDALPYTAIYNRSFIINNKINFNETYDSTESNISFSYLVFYFMSSIFLIRSAFYHCFIYANQINLYDYKKAIDMVNEHLFINKKINELKLDKDYVNLEVTRSFRDINKFYIAACNTTMQRIDYLAQAAKLLKFYLPLINANNVLSDKEKRLYKQISKHPIRTALLDKKNLYIKLIQLVVNIKSTKTVNYVKLFNFPIIFVKNTGDYKTFNICNIPIKRVKKTLSSGGTKTNYYYLWLPLSKKIDTHEQIRKYFLGIRVHKEINIQAQISALSNRISRTPLKEEIFYYASMANTVMFIHTKTFPQFKNINTGKKIAIFGTGPTLNFAPMISNVKTICCNLAFEFLQRSGKEPDYIFAHDTLTKIELPDILKSRSKIFLGGFIETADSISESLRNRENIYSYYASGRSAKFIIRPEIECHPLFDYGTIIHPAFHFALYTNPDIIYLLGCDTSNAGYYNNNRLQYQMNTDNLIKGYRKLLEFTRCHYPNTRIISINPIGLRGIFEDQYTKAYIEQDAELNLLNSTITDEI